MKKIYRVLAAIAALSVLVSLLSACGKKGDGGDGTSGSGTPAETHDYAVAVMPDASGSTLKQEVTVKTYIDGDTTHFNVPESIAAGGVLKARYLAVNTPESTGKIEEYGKAASRFTKEKLSGASSIMIESDDGSWNLDSTGGRYLVWVWYRPEGSDTYRNLNIELLQNGLAIASSSANNRYGDTCMAAIAQAKREKLGVHSGKKDPDFYYGDAVELTLRELRCNLAKYNGSKVAFEGVITKNSNSGVYVENYDAETDRYYGIYIYYGYGLTGEGLDILSVGNRARIVGSVQFYEAGGTYQISGLTYRAMKPDDPNNIKKLGGGAEGAYRKIDPADFAAGKLTLADADGNATEFMSAALMMDTTVTAEDLKVTKIYTTTSESSSQKGAMTMSCTAPDGTEITVRTAVLTDGNGKTVTADVYEGKTITVKGIVDLYDGSYQIRVFSANDIVTVKY